MRVSLQLTCGELRSGLTLGLEWWPSGFSRNISEGRRLDRYSTFGKLIPQTSIIVTRLRGARLAV